MSKGHCDYSCKHLKYTDIYETFEEKNSDGEVIVRWREWKGKKYYCDKCNDRYQDFIKEFEKNYRHKTVKWINENVFLDCYEPTDRQKLLDGMASDLEEFVKNIKIKK